MEGSKDVESAKKVGPVGLLNLREKSWSRRLRGSSLIAEVDVKDAYSEQVASVLGKVYEKWTNNGRRPADFFVQWPSCVAVALTGVAARGYQRGTFWPELWKAVRYRGLPEDQAIWGRGFGAALAALGMPAFPDMSMPYVGPILMHTGIPTYCLEDYFRLIAQRRTVDRGLDAEGFLVWATAPGREKRLQELDVPARRFLQHGTEFALDFVERSFDLLDRLGDSAPDLDGVGLPPRVLGRAQELAAEGRLTLTASRSSGGNRTRSERPRIALDPFGRGVEVVLPAISETPDGIARWNVTADGVTTTVRSQAQWVGTAEGAPSTGFSLLRPVRTVVVALAGWQHQSELSVVDPAAPLLVFAEDGRLLPPSLPLPPDVVWVVHPDEHELVADGPLTVTVEGQLPLGWDGWCLRQVSLRGVRSVELAEMPACRRTVRGYSHPRIVTGDPVRGVATPYGSPVYPRPPEIWLPSESGADTTWLIEVRSSGGDSVVASRSQTISGPTTVTDLWDSLPRPLLGAFDLAVRGPLGRGARRTVFVAEGLGVRFTPRVRVFGRSGLADGRAELSAAIGALANPRVLSFDADCLAGVVEYRTDAESEPLVVTPPHVQVMHERAAEQPVWRAGPLRITSDVFADGPGALLVRVPEARVLPRLRVVVGERIVQEIFSSGRVQEGTARYDLVKIADTVNEHQRADLLLDVGKEVIRAASIRPRRLAQSADRVNGHLQLAGFVPVEGLTAGIYAARAPWREPLIVPVEQDGRIPLLPELVDAGPLLLCLQVDDPWVPVEWPRWPDHYLTVGGEGHLVSEDPEETALSRFVAGEGGFPNEVGDLRRVWTALDLMHQLRSSSDVQRFRLHCSGPLLRRPADALVALVELGFEPDRTVVALITSGLAATAVPDLEQAGAARRMWPLAPAAAVLAGDLSDADCFSAAERQCGAVLAEITGKGVDPWAGVGRFGSEVERMVHLTSQQIEGIWRAANVVPQALLDADTRASAARRLFDARGEEELRPVSQIAAHAVTSARSVLGRPVLLSQVDRRRHPADRRGWYSLPAASTAFALLARLAARGDTDCVRAEQLFRVDWARLAAVAPDLVTIDLILAELLIGAGKKETQ
ncbi:hypothetical protein [Streptosporangium sp. H16]|uniref:hypothetical protein n=1 Tax=Streptosporangium sp. H16 TaxID=3444184 RepID=UPI003F7A8450